VTAVESVVGQRTFRAISYGHVTIYGIGRRHSCSRPRRPFHRIVAPSDACQTFMMRSSTVSPGSMVSHGPALRGTCPASNRTSLAVAPVLFVRRYFWPPAGRSTHGGPSGSKRRGRSQVSHATTIPSTVSTALTTASASTAYDGTPRSPMSGGPLWPRPSACWPSPSPPFCRNDAAWPPRPRAATPRPGAANFDPDRVTPHPEKTMSTTATEHHDLPEVALDAAAELAEIATLLQMTDDPAAGRVLDIAVRLRTAAGDDR
jgi:hypothetical protein